MENRADPLMAGVINSSKRRRGWMTSADVFDRDKLRAAGRAGAAEMTRLVSEYNAAHPTKETPDGG